METRVNQKEAQSMFVMVRFSCPRPYQGALYKVNLEHEKSSEASSGDDHSNLPVLDPVLKFFDKTFELPKYCLFVGARYGSKLYVMANGSDSPYKSMTTSHSFVFDTASGSDLHQFSPSKAVKPSGALISAYKMLYYFAHPPSSSPHKRDPSFERYNLTTNEWESLPSYPYKTLPIPMEVTGYAVCYGYILISLYNCKEYAMLAFHIDTETWHQVTIANRTTASYHYEYFPFRGRAVVVDNIIYASTFVPEEVIAFSFWRDSNDNCYLSTPVALMVDTRYPPSPLEGNITQNLVHLGKLDFCLVQTGRNVYSIEHQYLCATTFRILREGGEMNVRTLRSSVFQVSIMGIGVFHLNFSFTPDCEDVEPEERYCPTAPSGDESALNSEEKGNKDHSRWDVATDKQGDLFSIPTKPLITG